MHVHFPEDHCPSPRASQFNEPEVFYTAKMQLLMCWSPDASVVPVSFSVYRLFLSLSGCVHSFWHGQNVKYECQLLAKFRPANCATSFHPSQLFQYPLHVKHEGL